MALPWTTPCKNTNSGQATGTLSTSREHLASGLFFTVLSLITTLSNGLLLLALYKDPLRIFRTPSTLFVVSMTVANVLNGLLVGPLIAVVDHFSCDFTFKVSAAVIQMRYVFPSITLNASFFTVVSMSFDQYTAVSWPRKYRSIVSRRNVTASVACVWVYTTLFSSLPLVGVPLDIYYTLDLYLNTTSSFLLLLFSYLGLLKALRTRTRWRTRVQPAQENVGLHRFATQQH